MSFFEISSILFWVILGNLILPLAIIRNISMRSDTPVEALAKGLIAPDFHAESSYGKELSFNITCNGSLLTPEIIRCFSENSVNLMSSLDGPKEINDKNRVHFNTLRL